MFHVETNKKELVFDIWRFDEKGIINNMYILVVSSFTQNAGVERMPPSHMTATEILLVAPNTLAKQAPIWYTDLKEMVSIAKIYGTLVSLLAVC